MNRFDMFRRKQESAELTSARTLRELAEADFARKRAEHDRTGEHVWLDASTFRESVQICQFCSARRSGS